MSREPVRPRSDYPAFVPITTRWHDNDVYGHVNNVVYYAFFDTAVNTWLIDEGLLDIENGDPIGVVAETRCRYLRSVCFPQKLEVGLRVARLGNSSVTYDLALFVQGEDEPAAQGSFTHVYVDRANRRPSPLSTVWRESFAKLIPEGS